VQCKNPKACTIMLRGASKDILNEVERNLQDAMNVARNVMVDARLVPGGGAVEMALAHVSTHYSLYVSDVVCYAFSSTCSSQCLFCELDNGNKTLKHSLMT